MSDAKSMLKLGLVLALYAAASCTVLAVVNHFTAPKIEKDRIEKANQMLRELFPEADDFVQVKDFEFNSKQIKINSVYMAYSDGKVTGGAVQLTGPTYDQATVITGISLDGTVKGLKFLELSDSPGFGQKAKDPKFTVASGKTFYGQFEGMKAQDGFTVNQTFDGISGATITSRGAGDLVSSACNLLLTYFEEHDYE